MPKLSKEIREILQGNPFGDVYPPRPNPPAPVVDGRTAALRLLKKYFQELIFRRSGGRDPRSGAELPPIEFRIPERDIHVEWPDNVEEVHLPAIAFLSTAAATYEAIGMVSYVEEASRDVYQKDTILIWLSEFVETFVIEIWAETKSQRRAMLAGIEQAMTPTEQMYGLRFRMREYFDQFACFSMVDRELVDDEFATKNRRRAKIRVELRYNVVALVNATDFQPVVTVVADADEWSGEVVDVTAGGGE